jgi:hypothetical protein
VLFHNGVLWLYDLQSHRGRQVDRDVTAIAFEGEVLVLADSLRLVVYQNAISGEVVRSLSPSLDTLGWYHFWLIHPLYVLFPKPGELGAVVSWLLTDDEVGISMDLDQRICEMMFRLRTTLRR